MKLPLVLLLAVLPLPAFAQLAFDDASPQRYELKARASKIDPRAKPHPELGFIFETESGKPTDFEVASVDTRIAPRGKLVIWLMSHNGALFEQINSHGIHAIQVHYCLLYTSDAADE